jgi:hypothetical protein
MALLDKIHAGIRRHHRRRGRLAAQHCRVPGVNVVANADLPAFIKG